jgi:hypothetical protein
MKMQSTSSRQIILKKNKKMRGVFHDLLKSLTEKISRHSRKLQWAKVLGDTEMLDQ